LQIFQGSNLEKYTNHDHQQHIKICKSTIILAMFCSNSPLTIVSVFPCLLLKKSKLHLTQ